MLPLFRSRSHRNAPKAAESRPRRPRRQRLGLEALEGRQLLSLSPGVISVNTDTPGRQFESDVASSTAGSVVVWTTDHPNSSRHDIHAQRFFPNGTKNGEEFVVSNPDVFASD